MSLPVYHPYKNFPPVLDKEIKIWTPMELEDAVVFDALATGTITEDTGCSAWADMLGSGITAIQATAGAQPAVGDGVLTFDGGDYLVISGSKSAAWVKAMHSTGGTILAVIKPGIVSDPNTFYGIIGTSLWTSANIGFTIAYDDRASESRNNTAVTQCSAGGNIKVIDHAITGLPANVLGVHTWRIDPDNATASNRSKFSANGSSEIGANTWTSTPTTANATADLMIGGCGTADYGLLVGDIACLIFVPDVVSAEDLARLQGWAAHRHGVISLLPSDHPYKHFLPTLESSRNLNYFTAMNLEGR